MHRLLPAFACAAAVLGLTETASAQFGICKPVAERARPSDVGCWIVAHGSVGQLTQPQVYWHLDVYPTRGAAEAAKGRGTVTEALGRPRCSGSRTKGGGPPAANGSPRSGRCRSRPDRIRRAIHGGDFNPGMTAPSHEHAEPEAWYTEAGETCLETPEGKHIGRAGGPPLTIPAGPPMHLTATGTEQRRSLVLILHDAAQNPSKPRPDFVPKGLCKN